MIKKSLQVFLFLHKKSPTDRYVVSKYPKMTNKCYYLSMCTLTNFDKNLWSMKYSKMQKIIESIRQKFKNRILCSSKLISKLSWVELNLWCKKTIQLLSRMFLVAFWSIKDSSDRLTNLKITINVELYVQIWKSKWIPGMKGLRRNIMKLLTSWR